MPDRDYNKFCQDVLLACADAQVGLTVEAIDIEELCGEKFPDAPPTWVESVTATLVTRGFGQDWSTHDGHSFFIEGPGLSEARAIRILRKPKTISDRVRGVSRSDWIALGAFIVSIIALFK